MKLLFDANLSRRIVPMLDDLFPDCVHVSGVGFSGETADKIIWEFARLEGCAIVTADADFIHLAEDMDRHLRSFDWRRWITPLNWLQHSSGGMLWLFRNSPKVQSPF